jgi:hypothetical protein
MIAYRLSRALVRPTQRWLSFSFAGPKTLDDVMKKDLMQGKSGAEISDIWYSYHENKASSVFAPG